MSSPAVVILTAHPGKFSEILEAHDIPEVQVPELIRLRDKETSFSELNRSKVDAVTQWTTWAELLTRQIDERFGIRT